jgi:hypothetical protein
MKRFNGILSTSCILIFGLACLVNAQAETYDFPVDTVVPAAADQGQTLDVEINGSGFPRDPEVTFLRNSDNDADQIQVNSARAKGSRKIIANITVKGDADPTEYDVLVESLSNGRKGKGTTLFSVRVKNNADVVNCGVFTDSSFDPFTDPRDQELDPGLCNCWFQLNNESTDSGTPPGLIFSMITDCETAQTLVIPQFGNIRSLGAVQGEGSDRKTLTAVNYSPFDPSETPLLGGFSGDAIIKSHGHRATARDFDIAVGAGVSAGCDAELQTGILFEINAGSPNPTVPDPAYLHTRWRIQSMNIDTLGEALCRGIVARRDNGAETGYPVSWVNPDDGETYFPYDARNFIAGGHIMPGSYEKTAVLFEGFTWYAEAINGPEVFSIIIGEPADSGYQAAGIVFGDIVSSDAAKPVTGLVQDATISLGDSGTGILVYGAQVYDESDVRIDKNVVSGATVGILVDDNVAGVNFSGNILTGDNQTGSDDIGICSLSPDRTVEQGKPNRIKNYDNNEIQFYDCPGPFEWPSDYPYP